MVSAINSTTAAQGTAADMLSQGLTGDKALGRDAFLKLLVAQLRHQDPLKPQDDSAFVAQLAQFSSLEQTMGINDRLDTLSMQSQGLQNSQVVGLVGKQATVRGNVVTTDGSGGGVPLAFTLDGAAEKSTVTVRDSNGNVVRTLEVGKRSAGVVRLTWDGRNDAGTVQPEGSYSIAVSAANEAGGAVSVSQSTKGTVQSVSFDKGYPVLHLDSGVNVPVSDLLQVDSPPSPSK
ncbi:MAG TPA: FlgD immunoglobulin-like domain containing protein [Polyangiaceae bacterium]|nr:FlgD immunoglobulin-like domain containing protein [Polyangiaceae bacterium]